MSTYLRGPVTHITYWIQVAGDAYQESSPVEIQGFMDKGFVPDIRIMAERTNK
ncbi:hypothetical protein SEA_IBANTIK_103 [Streptomyces phage Ibantik]|uniref:Uncharacterized protein n=1 Tax=Streptomyces phage Ibantik TaxID=2182397 RepID=A0A2U8UNL6_9CAUD|nr:hypothetical protein QEH36_gp062 [Streptomyces phage Ibantik]AWN05324.1 hypothetical protein SEA_IBANTIK_103 [Streptomyces phage Ibantik]